MSAQISDYKASDPQMRGSEARVHPGASARGLEDAAGSEDHAQLLSSYHEEERVWTTKEAGESLFKSFITLV